MANGKVSNITVMATNIYRYIEEHPNQEVEDILDSLNITRPSFYRCLLGFKDEMAICKGNNFYVVENGRNLTVKDIKRYLEEDVSTSYRPSKVERILYLYNLLHGHIPYGGVSFDDIMQQYIILLEHSSINLPKRESISRSIYRDLGELEKIGIVVERPSTGNKKYCLRDKYLPKLSFEQASSLYISMLLFEDTILDQVSSSAKAEFEKAFFRNSPHESKKIAQRIHVVSDTLVNPNDFSDSFTKLIAGVINSYQITINYVKLNGEVSDRLLNPVGLVYKRGVWYLVAKKAVGQDYRTFRVDQILGVNLRNIQFVYPDDFSLREYIGSSWGVFTNDEVQNVKLKFSPQVCTRVKNIRYHRTQKVIEEMADGSIIIGLEVCGLIELKGWLLQWGKEVEVLEPIFLRQELRKLAQEVVELYE